MKTLDLKKFLSNPIIKNVSNDMDRLLAAGWLPQDIVGCLTESMELTSARMGVPYATVEDEVFAAMDHHIAGGK